jgi:hypothetical protein
LDCAIEVTLELVNPSVVVAFRGLVIRTTLPSSVPGLANDVDLPLVSTTVSRCPPLVYASCTLRVSDPEVWVRLLIRLPLVAIVSVDVAVVPRDDTMLDGSPPV